LVVPYPPTIETQLITRGSGKFEAYLPKEKDEINLILTVIKCYSLLSSVIELIN
jgi:hypothetical protein